MNADGSSPANISDNSASDSFPAWSADGSKIAFHTDRDGNYEVYVMDANGSGQTNLSNDGVEAGAPDWSPDGTKIAFRSKRHGDKDIYVMDADGSNQTRLTFNSSTSVDPSWSADGSQIAFASSRDGDYEVYVMDADGSGQTNRTSNSATDIDPAWSPTMPASHGFIWFTDAVDIGVTATGGWQDMDLSSHIPAGATGAIIELVNTATTTSYSAMGRGRQDTRDYMSNTAYGRMAPETHRWQIVEVDRNRLIHGYFEHVDVDFKLLGYTVESDPIYFDVPPEITPATTGAWTAVDVSSYVDAATDGVILLVNSTSSADRDYGVRETGSSDSATGYELGPYGSSMYLVGIDGSDSFDAYIQDAAVSIYLVGRTKGSVTYYSSDISVPDPATGAWQSLDADSHGIPAGANGLVLRAVNTSTSSNLKLGIRHGASTDEHSGDIELGTHLQAGVGLRDDNLWDEYIEGGSLEVYIAAYTRLTPLDVHMDILIRTAEGAVRETVATNVANSRSITESTWQTVTAKYQFPGHIVASSTDYLEVDIFADATNNAATATTTLELLIGDSTVVLNDQTPIREDPPPVVKTYTSGSYTGTGAAGNAITGVGFQPDVLIIKGDTSQVPVIHTASMGNDGSKPMLKVALSANLVESLDTDGFTLGTDGKVNGAGVTYYWSAFEAREGVMTSGSFTGIGSSQSIAGLGYSPEVVLVIPATSDESNIKTSAMPSSLAMQLDDEDGKTNRITSIDVDGFTVGSSGQANGSGKKYHYVAWNAAAGKMAQGSYSGDGADNRSVGGVGFQPKLVIIKAEANIEAVHHPDALGSATDSTLSFMAQANFNNGIQALESDGFQVGTNTTVNGNGTTYYWMAFTSS